MGTTRHEIGHWFDDGVQQGSAYMVVWCDTYDWSDYPAYYADAVAAQQAINNPSSMQKVMEVYELQPDKRDAQLSARRAFALRPT